MGLLLRDGRPRFHMGNPGGPARHIAWVKANADPCGGIFMPDAREAHSFIEWSPMGTSESWACLNAIYGMAKSQMKQLADYMPELGLHWDEPQAELKEEQFIGPSYAPPPRSSALRAGMWEKTAHADFSSTIGWETRSRHCPPTGWRNAIRSTACTNGRGRSSLRSGERCWMREQPLSGRDQADAERRYSPFLTTYTAYDSYRMSLCHSWSSTPVVWIARYVLGIRALEPGYARIAFEPHAIGAHGRTGRDSKSQGLDNGGMEAGGWPHDQISSHRGSRAGREGMMKEHWQASWIWGDFPEYGQRVSGSEKEL